MIQLYKDIGMIQLYKYTDTDIDRYGGRKKEGRKVRKKE